MGTIFSLIVIGIIIFVAGFAIGWDNDDKDVYILHCMFVVIGVILIAVALFKCYLLIEMVGT